MVGSGGRSDQAAAPKIKGLHGEVQAAMLHQQIGDGLIGMREQFMQGETDDGLGVAAILDHEVRQKRKGTAANAAENPADRKAESVLKRDQGPMICGVPMQMACPAADRTALRFL